MASSKVLEIHSDKQYVDELSKSSPSQLVVVDFFATWCGPCHSIAPKVAEFSQKFPHVKFLKVDVDKCQLTAIENNIKAMPTFLFLRNKQKLDELRGADPNKLETTIKSYMGKTFELEPNLQNINLGRSFPCFIDLIKNSMESFQSAGTILLRFANNILRDPDNLRYRQINLSNEIFMDKLLPVPGAVECLFAMGFQEMDDKLLLPPESSLENLHSIRDALLDEMSNKSGGSKLPENQLCSDSQIPKINENKSVKDSTTHEKVIVSNKTLCYVPTLNTSEQNKFYQKVVSCIEQVFLYENEELQKLARNVIPLENLEKYAEKDYQENLSLLSKRDCLLLNLLAWFKTQYFTWTDAPKCEKCGGNTKFHSIDSPNNKEKIWNSGNVECYQCFNCYVIIRFPRYNHPQKLLKTHTGRCGEWANCFTLCCRAVGFEARYVVDWTDHVWTEVYSDHQKRWLHCDSCENACDKPLVYETGWGKKLSYVIAFSKDEVVDVTWRYSISHMDICSRRLVVSEQWLLDLCHKATKELQANIKDEDRKSIMMNRHIVEIVEFLTTKKNQSEEEQQGRISGSLNWRQTRGETGSDKKVHIFQPSEEHIAKKRMRIRYLPAKDSYYTSFDDEIEENAPTIQGWQNGVESSENMFRKVENDWKMVYLARCEGSPTGSITWGIDIQNTNLEISHIKLTVTSEIYQNGHIDFKLSSENNRELINNPIDVVINTFLGSKTLHLTASFKGGSGDVAWQHAQLFRCSEEDETFVGMDIDIFFKD